MVIAKFNEGTLEDCTEGMSIRSYLSIKLNCNPMRISKKFAGQKMGKDAFKRKEGFEIYTIEEEDSKTASSSSKPAFAPESPESPESKPASPRSDTVEDSATRKRKDEQDEEDKKQAVWKKKSRKGVRGGGIG